MRAINDSLRAIYTAIGVDQRMAGACRRRAEGGGMGNAGAAGAANGRGRAGAQSGNATRAQGNQPGGGQLQPSPEFGALRQRPRSGLVFVAQGTSYHPKVVQLGQSNFDYTEVVSGLNEGERVVLLASLAIQAQRQQQNDRARQNANPLGGTTPGGGRGPGGPGGGGPGGGGGGGGRGGRG